MFIAPTYLPRSVAINQKLVHMFEKRAALARDHFLQRTQSAIDKQLGPGSSKPVLGAEFWADYNAYLMDSVQRSILLWDTLRQRGNQYLAHERAGKPPVLHFEYEVVIDARKFKRPVNYALLRILPPEGVTIDPKRRPYIVIDPRAGHGPGIGGFKDDSQVGVALRDGHPVYFVSFFPEPQPGQTLTDVTNAEHEFVHKVRELHPDSPKPVLIGNCQGGWAAMMLASANPDDVGPVVINGAPMSYWGGAWREGEGDNPMRYSAGLLGGTWLASLTSDLGNGIFDGAWLVQNFDNLNPANALWDKYYHVYANADTEPPRFLEFERWYGGYFLMNREEIEWITKNLFVGNKLWKGQVAGKGGSPFDLRRITAPIVLFASLGDNITPPQQAFNWVADVYGSTDEIKARGQVIVGLLHKDVGHLGIFVSGRVAKKEHTQIVSVLKSIEALPPGLYGMKIVERKPSNGKVEYDVEFVEHRLEEVVQRLNRFKRVDEKPFESVEEIAEFNQHAYEVFARPLMQAIANEPLAQWSRMFHPLRVQHWAISDLNPWLSWLGPAAGAVKTNRKAVSPESPSRQAEAVMSEVISASLDFYREIRDAMSEAMFYAIYGNIFSLHVAEQEGTKGPEREPEGEAEQKELVAEALANISKGGYAEAAARVFALLARPGVPFPLGALHLRKELAERYAALLPKVTPEERRRIRGMQDVIVEHAREKALETLPQLLSKSADRKQLRTLLQHLKADKDIQHFKLTPEQVQTLHTVMAILSGHQPKPKKSARKITPETWTAPERVGL